MTGRGREFGRHGAGREQRARGRILLAALLLWAFLSPAAGAVVNGSPLGALERVAESPRVELPTGLTPAETDSFLAGVTDAQARELLRRELGRTAGKEAASGAAPTQHVYTRMIMHLRDVGVRLGAETKALLDSLKGMGREGRIMLRNLTDDRGWPAVLEASGVLLLLVGVGFLVLIPMERLLRDLRGRLLERRNQPLYQRIARRAGDMAIGLLLVFIFALITLGLSFVAFERFHPLRVYVSTVLIGIAAVWGINVVLRGLFLARGEQGGPFRLPSAVALKVRHYLLLHFAIVVAGLAASGLLGILGISRELDRLLLVATFTLATAVLLLGIWDLRRAFREWKGGRGAGGPEGSLLRDYVRIWHWITLLGVAVFYSLWLLNTILDHQSEALFAWFGMLLVVLFPLFIHLLGAFAGEGGGREDAESGEKAGFGGLLRTLALLLYLVLAAVFLADALGAGITGWLGGERGRMLLQSLLQSLLAIATGVVVWGFFRSWIERRMPERKRDIETLMEGDGGGGEGATRSATLLPLLRNFVLAMIVATVVIIVLSSVGVNTAPLLAGAGVVGIAVGFGAQKLVQDVVSGIFFLIDDAFRVGEYIEAGDMMGTVESISARSVRLRHHLGPVQTIPFGEIKAVKNHSRDFVIMKLKFRVPFDTDIENVRKIIKKVGREMLKDPELGPDFLAPVKSQGVLNVEDDALLMRMKFTARPGKQWVIRREAYRRVKEALEREGIRFANKQVTVHIPEEAAIDGRLRAGIAGSAAGAAVDAQAAKARETGGR